MVPGGLISLQPACQSELIWYRHSLHVKQHGAQEGPRVWAGWDVGVYSCEGCVCVRVYIQYVCVCVFVYMHVHVCVFTCTFVREYICVLVCVCA